MESAITPVLTFLEEIMRNLEVSSGGGLSNDMGGNQEIKSFKTKWDAQLRGVAARVYGMDEFYRGRCFRSQM